MLGQLLVLMAILSACADMGSERSEPKIIGGNLATNHAFMVGLVNDSFEDRVGCGATLIRKNVAVTAAHCVEGPNKGSKIMIGTKNAHSRVSKTVAVKAIISHPDYKGKENDIFNDIAVLILDDYDLSGLEASVAPIELNRDQALPEALGTSKVIGWGNTTSHGVLFKDELREVTVPIVSIEKCKEANQDVNETQICAGDLTNGGIDSCQGDSGGPLVFTKEGKSYFAGIVSWGNGCAQKGNPGVYTRVSSYIEWIEKTVADYTEPQFDVNGKKLSNYVKNFCLSGFRSETFQAYDRTTLSVSRTFKPGESFVPAELFGKTKPGKTLDHCEFSISTNTGLQTVSVDLIEAEGVVRFEVAMGEKKYIGAAVESLGFSLACGGQPPFSVRYDASAMNFFVYGELWYLMYEEYDGGLEGFVSEAECTADTSSAVMLSKVGQETDSAMRLLMLKSPYLAGGFKVFKLMYDFIDLRAGIAMGISSSDGKKGTLSLVNESRTDIFTWRLSCNRELNLTDQNGVTYHPKKDGVNFVHEFVRPSHSLGTFLAGQRLEFLFESAEGIGGDLSCSLNSLAVDIKP
jgi:secreted trypsin-like serine protease